MKRNARSIHCDMYWRAIRSRDPAADGRFLYAVKTTGVFCRPTCRSRVPLRKNVEFFADAAEALRAGYRACRRCRPDAPNGEPVAVDVVRRACRWIESSATPPSLRALSTRIGLSPAYVQRLFKRTVGISPKQYAMALRDARFRRELRRAPSVTRAVYDAGFGSTARAYDRAVTAPGMNPRDVRRGSRGVAIRSAIVRTSLGHLLLVATDRGVCDIEFGPSVTALRSRLIELHPHATRKTGRTDALRYAARIAKYIRTPRGGSRLPLDIQGTAFQRRVWEALRRIPAGRTMSYRELAAEIGAPRAVRAVAQACAKNRLAVAVPCHRVVAADGGIGGYRWGVARKRALLRREAR